MNEKLCPEDVEIIRAFLKRNFPVGNDLAAVNELCDLALSALRPAELRKSPQEMIVLAKGCPAGAGIDHRYCLREMCTRRRCEQDCDVADDIWSPTPPDLGR